jgi:hypothetical protein
LIPSGEAIYHSAFKVRGRLAEHTKLRKIICSSLTPWEMRTSIAFKHDPPVAGGQLSSDDQRKAAHQAWDLGVGHIARKCPLVVWRTAFQLAPRVEADLAYE